MSPTHHRRSIRLKEYDYSWAGWYFVTLCSYKRECVFGDVVDDHVKWTRGGKILEKEWLRTPGVRLGVELDEFVVMPNHLHGILIIGEGDTNEGGIAFSFPNSWCHRTRIQINNGKANQPHTCHTRRSRLATQLLWTRYSKRRRPSPHSHIHPEQSTAMDD
jgi:hypothetical protein